MASTDPLQLTYGPNEVQAEDILVHNISGVEMRAYKNLADEGMAFGNKVRFHNKETQTRKMLPVQARESRFAPDWRATGGRKGCNAWGELDAENNLRYERTPR